MRPGVYGTFPSETATWSSVSPSRSGISRKAPLKSPAKSNAITSSTISDPSEPTWTTTSAAGSVNDFAAASPASTSAASSSDR